MLQDDNINEWNQRKFCGRLDLEAAVYQFLHLLELNKGNLSVAKRDRLQDIIWCLVPERSKFF